MVVGLHLLQFLEASTRSAEVRTLLSRARPIWRFGQSGLLLFFVLSGLLLFRPFANAMFDTETPWPSTSGYLRRRAARVLPAYWVALLVLVACGWADFVSDDRALDVLLHVTLLHNTSVTSEKSISVPLWSMAVEAQCYLLIPIVAAGCRRLGARSRARVLGLLVFGAVGAVVVNHLLVGALAAGHATATSTLAYLPVFLVGCGSAVIAGSGWRATTTVGLAGVVSLLLHAASGVVLPNLAEANAYPFNFAVGLSFAAVLLAVIKGEPFWARIVAHTWLRRLGLMSFSVYLLHWALIEHVVLALPRPAHRGLDVLWFSAMGLVIPIAAGAAFFTLVERPAGRLRRTG
jgi:peptidoglycan/LPS O-acetylase OafA/YrhL